MTLHRSGALRYGPTSEMILDDDAEEMEGLANDFRFSTGPLGTLARFLLDAIAERSRTMQKIENYRRISQNVGNTKGTTAHKELLRHFEERRRTRILCREYNRVVKQRFGGRSVSDDYKPEKV